VEGGNAIARLELEDVGAHGLDNASDVIALVDDGVGADVRELPVFGVAAGHDDFDEDLVVVWLGDIGVDDGDVCPWRVLVSLVLMSLRKGGPTFGNNGFLHFDDIEDFTGCKFLSLNFDKDKNPTVKNAANPNTIYLSRVNNLGNANVAFEPSLTNQSWRSIHPSLDKLNRQQSMTYSSPRVPRSRIIYFFCNTTPHVHPLGSYKVRMKRYDPAHSG
jgi:hypothetical protein